MPQRVVVSFRGVAAPLSALPGPSYLERALSMKMRAEAHGARLCAWSAQTFSFDFAPDEIEEAVSLAVTAIAEINVAADERFGVGVSEGELDKVGDGGSFAALSWGPPLLVAVSLARVARAGQILLDPALAAVRSGELLVASARVAMDMGRRVRGLPLDSAQPWRRHAAKNVARLAVPALIGLEDALEEFALAPGTLGVVRAEAGAGGTRVLHEAVAKLAPSRGLFVTPVGASREPLGAIRRALSRSAAIHRAPALPENLHGALDRLLAGEGAELASIAEIINAWLMPEGSKFGVLAVDDAHDVDGPSLDAIVYAVRVRGTFRVLMRLAPSMPLPEALAAIDLAVSIEVPPLARDRAERLVASFCSGSISIEAAQRWARRGGTTPLGVREALAEGLTTGELAWNGAVAVPRGRSAGRGGTLSAKRWIGRRMKYLSPEVRAVLTALAFLGGDASDAMIDALATAIAGRGARTAAALDAITEAGFASRPEPGWLKLSSSTARDVIAAAPLGEERRAWHAAAATTMEQHGGVLGRAGAAWHASVAGDRKLAARLAIDAAIAARSAGLDIGASTLLGFARDHDVELADIARRAHFRDGHGTSPPPPSTRRQPLDDIEEALPSEPRPRFDTLVDASMYSQFDPAIAPSRAPERSPTPVPPAPRFASSIPVPGETSLAERAKEALVQGDVAALEDLTTQLRVTGEHIELVERMSGLAALGRGAKEEALRKLRLATESDQPAAQRARALLAYGVALAASGRSEGALLAALGALARARQAGDRQGEHVCARFLARLSSAVGHASAAEAWAKVAQRSQDPGDPSPSTKARAAPLLVAEPLEKTTRPLRPPVRPAR